MRIKNKRALKKTYGLKDLDATWGPVSMAKTIRSWRICESYTQEHCAELLGVKKAYICDVEKGRTLVSPSQAVKFAKIMGEPEEGLMGIAIEDMLRRDGITKFSIDVKRKKSA
jgi:transcriptional regulator with XRE-family HTH domain